MEYNEMNKSIVKALNSYLGKYLKTIRSRGFSEGRVHTFKLERVVKCGTKEIVYMFKHSGTVYYLKEIPKVGSLVFSNNGRYAVSVLKVTKDKIVVSDELRFKK